MFYMYTYLLSLGDITTEDALSNSDDFNSTLNESNDYLPN